MFFLSNQGDCGLGGFSPVYIRGCGLKVQGYSLDGKPWLQALFFVLCAGVYLFLMNAHKAAELADDGAFFLRYAVNMLHGHFWVWNIGEAPVWGASAPLFPVFLTLPLMFGFDPVTTVMNAGIVAGAAGLSVIAWLLAKRISLVAGLGFLAFSATSSQITYWVGSGLETPLTIILLAFALFSIFGTDRPWIAGVAAGLLMIHKLDMVPVGLLVLASAWLRDRRVPATAAVIALLLSGAWYLFAWWYFGAPVPNSFITKALHQSHLVPIIDWRWYGQFVLLSGINKYASVCLLGLAWAIRPSRPVLCLFGGLLLIHLTAYTIKHPVEPYAWYGMGAMTSLFVLASVGLDGVARQLARLRSGHQGALLGDAVVLVFLVTAVLAVQRHERGLSEGFKVWADNYERDRADAGRWVAAHTPESYVVMAGHGNPAYFSGRKVIDSSYLNRRYEAGNVLERLRPEIYISPGNPSDPDFSKPLFSDYQVVKIFDRTFSSGVDSKYWFAVLARKDAVGRMSGLNAGPTAPVSVEKYVSDVSLGDQFGVLRSEGSDTLFIHPGATTPTGFDFDASGFAAGYGGRALQVTVSVSPKVPPEAVARGAAVARVTFSRKGEVAAQSIVKVGSPFHFTMPANSGWRVVVDNYNGPDTDWILISFN